MTGCEINFVRAKRAEIFNFF